MTFENIIKRVSQVLAAAFMFLMADGFYLSQKGFNWVDGSLVLVKPAEASVPAGAGGGGAGRRGGRPPAAWCPAVLK